MANENETVEQVCLDAAQSLQCEEVSYVVMSVMRDALERIEAAHKREIADFQRRYDECVRKFNEADLERVRLRGEVAAKDAKIATLSSLVKELAVVAERYVSCAATECETVCGVGERCIHKKTIALIAKAREMIGGDK